MTHSLRPWRSVASGEDNYIFEASEKSEVVGVVFSVTTEGVNNVPLVLAAPDLLAALKGMLDFFNPKSGQGVVIDCVMRALAAVAKAEDRL